MATHIAPLLVLIFDVVVARPCGFARASRSITRIRERGVSRCQEAALSHNEELILAI